MLKQLTLENWKSFRHAVLPIDSLTVLIGTNASGKSNAIEALEFLKRTALGNEFKVALAGDTVLPSIRGGLEWAATKTESYFKLKALVQGEDDNIDYFYSIMVKTVRSVELWSESLEIRKYDVRQERDIEKSYLFTTEELNTDKPGIFVEIFSKDPYSKEGRIYRDFKRSHSILSQLNTLAFISQEIEEGVKRVSETLQNIFSLDPIPSKMRFYSPLSDTLQSDASNIAGVLAALPDHQKKQVESTLTKYIRDLPERDIQSVWAETVGRFKSDAMLYCKEQWADTQPPTEIDARGMSDGTLRFLGILTALLTRPKGSQLIIEDVDNGLHPSRSELLVKMLREIGEQRKIDILVTTHNPALLDALGSEIVPFVVVVHRDSETGKSKLTLLENLQNFSKLFASASLGQLTENGAIERSLAHTK